MPLFKYEIADSTGKTLRGVMDAGTESHVRERLATQGYSVIQIIPTAAQPASIPIVIRPAVNTSRTTAPPKELSIMFRNLQSYLHSGMTVFQALDQIARTTRNSGMRTICQRMSQRIQNGDGLSVAMSEFPRAFPSHVVGVVAAGELGGFLPVIVGDIAFDYELTQRASSKWVSWISKLGWLNAAGVLFISPFLPLAVPILAEKGIPGFPAAFGVYLKYTIPHVGIPILLAYGGYYIAGFLAREPSLRPVAQRLLLRMPVYGKASKMRSLASFSRMFWRLQNAGLLPIRAWEAASRAAVNPEVAERLQAQIPVLQSGRKISDAFSMTGLFSEDDIRLLSMAETGGQIVESLERMAAYYEDAAVTSTNGPKQVAVHAVLLVNLIVMAYCFYCVEIKTNLALFDYVDKLFKAD